jgi:hypothetical protein
MASFFYISSFTSNIWVIISIHMFSLYFNRFNSEFDDLVRLGYNAA